jgi:hypothetical protein
MTVGVVKTVSRSTQRPCLPCFTGSTLARCGFALYNMQLEREVVCMRIGSATLILGGLLANAAVAREGTLETVDIKKIEVQEYTRYIEHVVWPSKQDVAGKGISNGLIRADIEKFKTVLRAVLKPGYLLSDEAVDSNAVAAEKLRRGNDYILLQYTRNRRDVEIQDGKGLYIGVYPARDLKIEQNNLVEYVRSEAFLILNLPEVDLKGDKPEVFVSTLDVGNSKCGRIFYKANFHVNPWQWWYSYIGWWSDGRNVLFEIGKSSFTGEDWSRRAGPPPNLGAPRRFQKENAT